MPLPVNFAQALLSCAIPCYVRDIVSFRSGRDFRFPPSNIHVLLRSLNVYPQNALKYANTSRYRMDT